MVKDICSAVEFIIVINNSRYIVIVTGVAWRCRQHHTTQRIVHLSWASERRCGRELSTLPPWKTRKACGRVKWAAHILSTRERLSRQQRERERERTNESEFVKESIYSLRKIKPNQPKIEFIPPLSVWPVRVCACVCVCVRVFVCLCAHVQVTCVRMLLSKKAESFFTFCLISRPHKRNTTVLVYRQKKYFRRALRVHDQAQPAQRRSHVNDSAPPPVIYTCIVRSYMRALKMCRSFRRRRLLQYTTHRHRHREMPTHCAVALESSCGGMFGRDALRVDVDVVASCAEFLMHALFRTRTHTIVRAQLLFIRFGERPQRQRWRWRRERWQSRRRHRWQHRRDCGANDDAF